MNTKAMQPGASKGDLQWRTVAGGALAVAAGTLLYSFWRYLLMALRAIRFPFKLDYGEGIVWQQMRLIVAGKGYGTIDGLPAIVFHYPPLYHVLVAGLAGATGLDELAAGRLLSIGSTIAAGILIACIVARLAPARSGQIARWMGGSLAALIALNLQPVSNWSILMRVDMVFIALSFAGLWFGMVALTKPRAVHGAALLFVAAIYTKQTALAAPVAVFAMLLVLRPRTALAGIATTMAVGLAGLAFMMEQTGGRFITHILFYNINRFERIGLKTIIGTFLLHSTYVVMAVLAVWRRVRLCRSEYRGLDLHAWRARLLANPADAGFAMVLIYFTVATLMLAMAMKTGASLNYMIEWTCLAAVLSGLLLVDGAGVAMGEAENAARDPLATALPLAVAAQAFMLIGMIDDAFKPSADLAADTARLVSLVHAAPQPVISDDMVAVLRAGKSVQWEPAIFSELASKGVWDERPFIGRIRARQFAFFVTYGGPGDLCYDRRYTPAVSSAMRAAYPVERQLAGFVLHFPPGPLPAYAANRL